MKVRFNSAMKALVVAAALACASTASAQSAGQWTAKFGFNQLSPKVDSGDISAPALPGTKADVESDIQPVLIIAYGLTDNISLEGALGTPYKHKIMGAGAIAGTGELGTVEALPPTLFAQYRFFAPSATFRPYVGLGATYAYFMKERGSGKLTALTNPGSSTPTTFEIDNKFTYTAQVGVAMNLTDKWFADVTVNKSRLRTDVHFSTGQNQHMKLDPVAVVLAVGYKF
ncbi:outer membrane beta-barrel protein [Massilia sp. Dwa41.01b]|uniref:OmpW/AlkL family protein n=1 Tax=unclassified Massilia TaxID=2609279 RepID=UPI001601C5C8|nr:MULTISPECIES: OmpW family outer membrane protein [unclassified Massilia]QNA90562.1 outer membrane beta-barrel protein [Massilia sp. Dwa41.01b]QNA97792.1 outer membrane beta-barrel protein [Massilia sp. Se16.2.3]